MRWVIKRLLVVWLTLIVICLGVIAVARLNPVPDVLQSLGFSACDAEPCFRGIKAGMAWADAKHLYFMVKSNSEGITVDPTESYSIAILPSDDEKDLYAIDVESLQYPPHLPIFLGQIIAKYGTPAGVKLVDADGLAHTFYMCYTGFTVSVPAAIPISSDEYDFRLQPESPVLGITITDKNVPLNCWRPNPAEFGSWHGFASDDVYFADFSRDNARPQTLSAAQP